MKIVKWNCWTESGQLYHQFDLVVDGITDTGWCDSLCEAHEYAARLRPGIDVNAIPVEFAGDLPQERY